MSQDTGVDAAIVVSLNVVGFDMDRLRAGDAAMRERYDTIVQRLRAMAAKEADKLVRLVKGLKKDRAVNAKKKATKPRVKIESVGPFVWNLLTLDEALLHMARVSATVVEVNKERKVYCVEAMWIHEKAKPDDTWGEFSTRIVDATDKAVRRMAKLADMAYDFTSMCQSVRAVDATEVAAPWETSSLGPFGVP